MKLSIFNIDSQEDFDIACQKTFEHQYQKTQIYRKYVDQLGIQGIPFLPISFFKTHQVISQAKEHEIAFTSSGTSGMSNSQHLVADLEIYHDSFMGSFSKMYGPPEDFCFLALLPSYLQREGSSLIYMLEKFIENSSYPQSGFYLDEFQELSGVLADNHKKGIPTILLGVSYALLDLAEQFPQDISSILIMETGGMKGNRPEMMKAQLHQIICSAFNVEKVHSEYGMTELLSQAYSKGNGLFYSPPWMKIEIRDIYDPFATLPIGKTGGINIIDLANIHSCSFIQTDDLGRINEDGSFEILGRLSASEIRGCNLLIQ